MSMLSHDETSPTRLNGIRLNEAVLGRSLPILLGQQRCSWHLGWYGDFTSTAVSQGGKGGKGATGYAYYASVLGLICMGPCVNFLGVWGAGGTGKYELDNYSETYTIAASPANPAYTPAYSADFAADNGVAYPASYSVTVNDYGSPGATTYSGTQSVPLQAVTGATPAAGSYAAPTAAGQPYIFNSADAGKVVTVNYTGYRYQIQDNEVVTVPFTGPYQVTVENQSAFKSDVQVLYYPSGAALTEVAGITPTQTGTYNPNNGNYLFAPGDAGAGMEIYYIYTESNTDTNAPTTLGLTFQGGGLAQNPWAYLTANHPSFALGYSEVAYCASQGMYLGQDVAALPQLSFEIAGPYQVGGGIVDANPAVCIYNLMCNPEYKLNFPTSLVDDSLLGTYSVPGSLTSGAFIPGENVVQTTTGVIGTLANNATPVGPTLLLKGILTVSSSISGTTTWVGQQSGAVFTPVSGPTFTGNSSAQAFWAANNFFISSLLDQPSALMSVIGDYCEAGNVFSTWDEGVFKFIPLGDTTSVANGFTYYPPTGNKATNALPVVDLDDDAFLADKGKDPIQIDQAPWQSRYNRTSIRWTVRENGYNEDTYQIEDTASIQQYRQLITEGSKDYQFITTFAAVQAAASWRLFRNQSIFTTYKFQLKNNYCFLSPGDIVTISDGLINGLTYMFGRTPVRIVKMTDNFPDEKKGIEIEAEAFPWSVGAALIGNPQTQQPSNTSSGQQTPPGMTTATIVQVPDEAALFAGDTLFIGVDGAGEAWGGCYVYVSSDNETYTRYTQIDKPARIGTLTAPYPYYAASPDNADILSVAMVGGAQLDSVSSTIWNNYGTLSALIDNNTGTEYYTGTAGYGVNFGTSSSGPGAYAAYNVGTAVDYPANPTLQYYGGLAANGTGSAGNVAWANLANIDNGLTPNVQATTSHSPAGASSTLPLNVTGFGFNPPASFVTGGITVFFNAYYASAAGGTPNGSMTVQLLKAGVPVGTPKTVPSASILGTGFLSVSLGGDTDLWGYSAGFASTDLSNAGFGIQVIFTDATNTVSDTVYVEYVSISAYQWSPTWVTPADVTAPGTYTTTSPGLALSGAGNQPQQYTHHLTCNYAGTTNPFNIPASGIGPITGIAVSFNAYKSGTGSYNVQAQLLASTQGRGPVSNAIRVGGNPVVSSLVGLPKTGTITATSAGTLYTFGGSGDLWGMTGLSVLTPSQINAQSFGVDFFGWLSSVGSGNLYLSNIVVTVYWAGGAIGIPWTNPNNITSAVSYATCAISSGTNTLPLAATDFGFVAPFGFTPAGVQVTVEGYSSTSTSTLYAALINNGQVIGIQKSLSMPTANGIMTFSPDLWGNTATVVGTDLINNNPPSPNQIEGFGVELFVVDTAAPTIHLRNCTMTVNGNSVYHCELVSYQTATLEPVPTSPPSEFANNYNLTNIYRGVYGSWSAAFPVGSTFMRLDANCLQYQVPPIYRGGYLYFKFCSFNSYGNQIQSLAEVPYYAVPILNSSSAPGAINNADGSLTTGTAANAVSRIDTATNAVHGTYGINSIPQGYGLFVTASSTASGTPVWNPIVTGGGGAGTVQNIFTIDVGTSPYSALAWDYLIVDTASGNVTINLPAAIQNADVEIVVTKATTDGNSVIVVPYGSDTIGFTAGSSSFVYQNTTISMVSDGTSNWILV